MNSITNNMNSINFQAKLDITKINGSAQRWQKIADVFEKITTESPKEVVKGYGSLKSGLSLDLVMDKVVLKDCCLSEWGTKKLAELTDLEIASKLKTIFALMQEHVSIEKNAVKEFNKNNHAHTNGNVTNDFRKNVLDKLNAATQKTLSGDSILAKSLYI